MNETRVYINSMAQVSCQKPLSEEWLDSPCFFEERYTRAQEPDTKGLIMPSEARRMSKILKRTIATSITALNNSEIKHPDAIITGTGMGCMENSEKFLVDLSKYGENCLKPTLFMQSTHNTISSLIAIILKCHGYNNTYSHKGVSFEDALFDAWLQIKTGAIRNALVGAHDEVTPLMSLIMEETHPEYSLVSETSCSMVLSSAISEKNLCSIEFVELLHRPNANGLVDLIEKNKGDVLILGVNGNAENDQPYSGVVNALSEKPTTLQYKNVFGNNFSVSAMSVYVGAIIMKNQAIPDYMIFDKGSNFTEQIQGITILNHSDGTDWSVIRLKKA